MNTFENRSVVRIIYLFLWACTDAL